MSACAVCQLAVGRLGKDKISCSDCKSLYHKKCAYTVGGKELSEAEFELLSKNSWRCTTCMSKFRKQRCASVDLTPIKNVSCESPRTVSETSMNDFSRALRDLKKELLGGQTVMQDSLKSCHDKLDGNSAILSRQEVIIKNQQEIIRALQLENESLREKVSDLSLRCDDLEQYGRRNTIEIHGIPMAPTEDVTSLVVRTCEAAGVKVTADAIDCCHRLKGRVNAPPPIIVKFVRRTHTHAMLDARRQVKGLSTRHIAIQGEERQIYVNLSLTMLRRKLFNEARKLQKQLNLKYVWVDRGGNVKIRIVPDGRVYTVRTEKDLNSVALAAERCNVKSA